MVSHKTLESMETHEKRIAFDMYQIFNMPVILL